jgi:hypothetical protein
MHDDEMEWLARSAEVVIAWRVGLLPSRDGSERTGIPVRTS